MLSSKNAIREELIGRKYKFHAPNKMCKRSLIVNNGYFFAENRGYEDVFTTYKWILSANKVVLVKDELYFYLQKRIGSITNDMNIENLQDIFEAMNSVIMCKEIEDLHIKKELQVFYVTNVISLSNYLYKMKNSKILYDFMRNDNNWKLMNNVIFNYNISLFNRVRAYLIKNNFRLYCNLMYFAKGVKIKKWMLY